MTGCIFCAPSGLRQGQVFTPPPPPAARPRHRPMEVPPLPGGGGGVKTNTTVVAQWIRPWTLNHKVPGSNPLAAAIVTLDDVLYPHHCL